MDFTKPLTRFFEHINYFYTAFCAIFLALLASAAVNYILTKPAFVPEAPQVKQVTDAGRTQMAMSLTERNLFGIEKVTAVSSSVTKAASNNWKLTGVLLSQKPENSRVIVVVDGRDVFILSTQKESGGMLLKSATPASAVFSYGGQDYMLELEAGQHSKHTNTTGTAVREHAPPGTTVKETGENHFTVSRTEVNDRLKDINSVLRSMLVTPLYDGENFMGYRIARMGDDAPLTLLGLRRGDIINRLNGEELTNPQALFEMLGKVSEIDAVTVDVTREGEKKTIFVEIQ